MIRFGIAALMLIVSCNQGASTPRCERVCQREAACFEELKDKEQGFDHGDCLRVCSGLERDDSGRARIAAHAECVDNASTCADVRNCR